MSLKSCAICGDAKERSKFSRNERIYDGLSAMCKICEEQKGSDYFQRKSSGSSSGKTKKRKSSNRLTVKQVVEIRNRYAQGERITTLAEEYERSFNTINGVVRGDTYRMVVGAVISKEALRRKRDQRPKLTMSKARKIRKEHLSGISKIILATKYGVSKAAIYDVISEKTYKEQL